jgi:5-methyltetrahydrofolate--homocysteine methyltransferase
MNFLGKIKDGQILVFDGAMGTQLGEQGVEPGAHNNITAPEKVETVHNNYINNGSDVIITNTLTANRIYIESHDVKQNVNDINLKGVEIARKAAGSNTFVAGDISSTGQMMEPFGLYTEQQFIDNFKEQAVLLEKAGVDLFIIETIMDLKEAICALKACKEVSRLPVVVSITFSTLINDGRTIMGNSAEECAKKLTDNGADCLGANCGDLDPFEMAKLVSLYKQHSSLPFLAQPNAGKPKLVGDKTVFDMPVATFADGVQQCINAGASMIGGCCGTSPEYINAISKLVK